MDDQSIENLISAGALIKQPLIANIQPASYDLRVGNIVWCKGKRTDLRTNQGFSIPPYSYVVIEAYERAAFPRFIIANYDLKISLFAQGIILSNGPQVDPGYGGILSCMLFNCSDVNVGLKQGEHFGTIEFLVTTRVTKGYIGPHQSEETLDALMSGTAQASSGGTIIERINGLESSWGKYRGGFYAAAIGAFFGLMALVIWGYETMDKAKAATEQADAATQKLNGLLNDEKALKTEIEDAIQKTRGQPETNNEGATVTPSRKEPAK